MLCTSHDLLASTRPSLACHLIRSNLTCPSPSRPGMSFYLINRITSHLTSNSMLCDNTFLCPRTLFSSPISSWLGSPQPREVAKLSLFQPPGVHKEPRLGPNHQSHHCCCHDNTSPRPASTSTSAAASGCWMPRLRGCFCVTLLVSTKRTADFHSQVTLPLKTCSRVTVHFHSQVNSPLKTCLQVHQWLSLSSQSPLKTCLQVHQWLSLSSESPLKTCLQVHHWLSLTSHCWLLPFGRLATVLFSLCSHLALVILMLPLHTTSSVRRTPTVGLVSLVVQYLLGYCTVATMQYPLLLCICSPNPWILFSGVGVCWWMSSSATWAPRVFGGQALTWSDFLVVPSMSFCYTVYVVQG